MYTPNPILFAQTPAGGHVLPIATGRGGLAGYILLGQSGPSATVEVSADGASWAVAAYPYTLVAGETLRLARADASATLTTLRALAPHDDGLPPEPEAPPEGGEYDLTPYYIGQTTRQNGDTVTAYDFTPPPTWLDTATFVVFDARGNVVFQDYYNVDSADGIAATAFVWGVTNRNALLFVAHPNERLSVTPGEI